MMLTTLHFNISITFISFDARLHNHLRALHHTGSQTKNLVVIPEELEEQLEVQQQEVTEAEEEVGEDLPSAPITVRALLREASPGAFLSRFANNLLLTSLNLMHYV
jgi:hypothetical protein